MAHNCHEKSSSCLYFFELILLGVLVLAISASAQTKPQIQTTEPPPAEPPASIPRDHWDIRFETQDLNGDEYVWTGHPVEFEDSRMLLRADSVRYNRDTSVVLASGNVYFRSFESGEQLWCDHLEYNTDEEKGKFYDVKGETTPRLVARPGILMANSPFHFEGKWAERVGEKYFLYNGWVTNCKLPKPWWRLRGPRFEIVPGRRALAYRTEFLLLRFPLFYTPFFYHSLEKEPRKSGFLAPSPGHSSIGGFMLGLGYYWAINRSNDVTYRVVDYVSRGYAHHIDLRGKPRPGTDYDVIFYGVQDRGQPNSGNPPQKYGGMSLYAIGKSDLGDGWEARVAINYISSFRFRQGWTQSYNEAIGSEIHSTAFIHKDFSTFTFDAVFSRLQNYENLEQLVTDPATGGQHYETDAVTIRKLPEVDFGTRDVQLRPSLPLWFSFDSSAGLLSRSEPYFQTDSTTSQETVSDRFQTGEFMSRVNVAPHVTTAFHWGSFNLVPSLGFQETFYSEAQTPYEDHYQVVGTNIVRSARDFSLDLIFPSLSRVFNKKTVFGDKLKHVIEPRVTYHYVTGVGDDFNRFIRFDETDLLANTNEVELSLTNRIYAKRGDSVQEIFTWEVAQKRYFDPTFGGALVSGERNVFASTADLTGYAFLVGPRSASPVVSMLRISPIGGLGIRWLADYDPRQRGLSNSSFALDYYKKKFQFSAGNDAVHTNSAITPPADQFRFRTAYGDPNHRGWNWGAVSVYDYRQAKLLYTTMQVTYNTDCCGFSVEYHRYNVGIRDEGQWRAAFVIANIGTFGTLRKQDRLF
jgi:LPS-assembly protein